MADVRALPVDLRRIVAFPELVKELFVADPIGVKGHPDHFRVTGVATTHVAVGRIRIGPASVTDLGRRDSGDIGERHFDAPETPCSKCCSLHCLPHPPARGPPAFPDLPAGATPVWQLGIIPSPPLSP